MCWWGSVVKMKFCLVLLCVWRAKMKLVLFRKSLRPKRTQKSLIIAAFLWRYTSL